MDDGPRRPRRPVDPADQRALDALLKDLPPFGDGSAWHAPGIFHDDAEVDEFVAFTRAERNQNLL